MFANIGIAINGLLRSRKSLLWFIVLALVGALAVLTGEAQLRELFLQVLTGGATVIAALNTLEDFAEKWNKPADPAG